ncbi:MAG: hypothetical protein JKY52_11570 [Flavobacteriales bacterium]|nr:hypothetical protein [Flavobacteriales bacterium]
MNLDCINSDSFREELKGYHDDGKDLTRQFIDYDGNYWFVKNKDEQERKRDYLAYLFGKDWTNIAEVRLPNDAIVEAINEQGALSDVDENRIWLVRMGQCYTKDDFNVINLDQAVATELVFSLWIRRRDTHSYNRVYKDGLPIFIDHRTGFKLSEDWSDIDRFFDLAEVGAGFANAWRVRERGDQELTTDFVRRYEKSLYPHLTIHFVNDIKRCERYIDKAVNYIINNSWDIRDIIKKADFTDDQQDVIYDYLILNRNNLGEHIKKMKSFVFSG